MTTFSQVSHISFSARDAEASAGWYSEVLGFTPLDRSKGAGWFGILLLHPGTRTIVEFQQHEDNAGEEFDPRRTGFDHLAFRVDTRAELDGWLDRFDELGVRHSAIEDHDYGSVLCFRDPDAIQLEMFYRENHP